MTSVPRPFKFLKTHYQALTDNFNTLPDSDYKVNNLAYFLETLC